MKTLSGLIASKKGMIKMQKEVDKQIQDITLNYLQESEQAVKNLLEIIGIDHTTVDREALDETKARMKSKGYSIQNISRAGNPFRLLMALNYHGKFVAGYVVCINLQRNVLKRVLVENEQELKKAKQFLQSSIMTDFSLERDA
jgi:hypothetical protein